MTHHGIQCTCYICFSVDLSFNVGISQPVTMDTPPATHGYATTPAVPQADTGDGQHYRSSTSYTMGHTFYAGMLQSNTTRTARSLTYTSQNPSSTNSLHRRPSLFHSRRPNRFSWSRARGSSAVRSLLQLGRRWVKRLAHT
jgi:hypothetical protein